MERRELFTDRTGSSLDANGPRNLSGEFGYETSIDAAGDNEKLICPGLLQDLAQIADYEGAQLLSSFRGHSPIVVRYQPSGGDKAELG